MSTTPSQPRFSFLRFAIQFGLILFGLLYFSSKSGLLDSMRSYIIRRPELRISTETSSSIVVLGSKRLRHHSIVLKNEGSRTAKAVRLNIDTNGEITRAVVISLSTYQQEYRAPQYPSSMTWFIDSLPSQARFKVDLWTLQHTNIESKPAVSAEWDDGVAIPVDEPDSIDNIKAYIDRLAGVVQISLKQAVSVFVNSGDEYESQRLKSAQSSVTITPEFEHAGLFSLLLIVIFWIFLRRPCGVLLSMIVVALFCWFFVDLAPVVKVACILVADLLLYAIW